MQQKTTAEQVVQAVTAYDARRRQHASNDPIALDPQLREAHAAAVERRQQIIYSLPPLEDVLATIPALVERVGQGEAWRSGSGLLSELVGKLDVTKEGAFVARPGRLHDSQAPLTLAKMAWLFPALTQAGIEAAARAAAAESNRAEGPHLADRPRLLEEADAEIARIEEAHTALVDAAAALDPPIALEYLPVVAARLQEARLEAERTARRDAERREREERLNAMAHRASAVTR